MEVEIERMGGKMGHKQKKNPICNKTLYEDPNYISEWTLPCPTWMRISLSLNWLTSKVSVHSPCNGQAIALQNAKGKFTNDQNIFKLLMKYFYNPPKVLQV